MDLLKADVKKAYRSYLFPALSGAVVTSVYSMVDAVAVGQSEGPVGAAAMVIINPFWGFIMFIGMIFGLVFTGICVMCPKQITALFMDATPEVLAIAPGIMRRFFIIMLFMGINIVAIYYLQSVLQSGKALIISLARGLIISGALAVILPFLMGENGLWLALPTTETVVFVIAAVMLLKQQAEAIER